MKLNVLERITALGILPKEGNFATLKIVNDLRMVLSLTEDEYKEFEVRQETQQDGDRLIWNLKGQEEREIEIGEKATDVIVESLKELDKTKKLTQELFGLYGKFIEG